MKYYQKLILLMLPALIMLSCSRNTVNVDEFAPKDEVPLRTNFRITFSEELAPANKQKTWLDDEFIKFTPEIKGRFKWISPNVLVFSPDHLLEPMQNYTAEITEKALFNTVFSPDFDKIEFKTPDFEAKSADLFWTHVPNEFYKMSVEANLRFTYPVNPAELKKHLRIIRNGEPHNDFTIKTENPSDEVSVNLGNIQQTEEEQEIKFIISKGLHSVYKKDGLKKEVNLKKTLPPISDLEITKVVSGFDGATGWIAVQTTQKVDESKLSKYVSLDPERDMKFTVFENSFRIESDLGGLRVVDIKIKKGLPGLYGGELKEDYVHTVVMAEINPSIDFADKKGRYLLRSGLRNLSVNVVNIDEIEIEVQQVFSNNLVHFLDRYDYYMRNRNYYWTPNFEARTYGRTLYSKKMRVETSRNWLQAVNLSLDTIINFDKKGIYILTVRDAEDYWNSDSKFFAFSDIGMIAKKSGDQIMVFLNNIGNTEPITGADVKIISDNNQTLLQGKSTSEGVVIFENIKEKTGDYTPAIVVAEKGEDFNFLDFSSTAAETTDFDVGGIVEYSDLYNVFIYSDRDIYRPGETAYISAIVRDKKINRTEDIPLIVKITSPTGRTFNEYKTNLNPQGSFEMAIDIPDFAETGSYRCEVLTGDDNLVGVYSFSVEDFVPDKIRVFADADKEDAFPGEDVNINVKAEFLFGAKGKDLKYEADIIQRRRDYKSEKYKDYDFSNYGIHTNKAGGKNPPELTFQNPVQHFDGILDDQGEAVIKYEVPDGLEGGGYIAADAFVSVFDLTGRTVNRAASFKIYPNNYFIGFKKYGYYFGTREKINFDIVAVDHSDKPLNNFNATAKLIRFEWKTVLKKRNNDNYYYQSEKIPVEVWSKDITINKEMKLPVSTEFSGHHELRIMKKDGSVYYASSFYTFGWASRSITSYPVDRNGKINIILDKNKYKPGDIAKAMFMCPFSGKMLVTIERDGVYDYQYVNVEKNSAEIEIPVLEEHLPNVYITATLFKEHKPGSKSPLLVGHGFKPMIVEKSDYKLDVAIEAPDKVKPNTKVDVKIKTEPDKDIYVTLAAVDEGILQIKGFETPDPFGYMYAKRKLKTATCDLYEFLLPEVRREATPGGGEALFDMMKKAANPVKAERFKLFAFWSGILRTDSRGRVTVPVDIPQFNGEVRLMAVAYKDKAFGSADKAMKVADKIILRPQIPRFLTSGDVLKMPVTAINTTDKSANININLELVGPLKNLASSKESLSIEPKSTATAYFEIEAESIGAGKITFETDGYANIKNEIEIAVRPPSPLVRESGSGQVNAGKTVSLDLKRDFYEGTANGKLVISKFPAVRFSDQLRDLLHYPYGCIEQTASQAFPLVYFQEMAEIAAPEMFAANEASFFVNEAILKIQSQQLPSGAFLYWPGGSNSNWWTSVYVTHFLVEAKKAGFRVSERMLGSALNYLADRVSKTKKDNTFEYVYYRNNTRHVKNVVKKQIPYSLYVLALAGRPDISAMNYYKFMGDKLSRDSKYLLAAAYAHAGRWQSYYSTLPSGFETVNIERQSGGTFDSGLRANALILNVLVETDPDNKDIPTLIRYISQNSKDLYSTQEKAFAFLALGKAAKRNLNADVKVTVNAGGKKIGSFNGTDLILDGNDLVDELTLESSGNGSVYYFWETEGMKKALDFREYDNNMKARRQFYDYLSGTAINSGKFKQGQLVKCVISLTGGSMEADNIAISNLIPAGFEIENPRLSNSRLADNNSKNRMKVDYLDVRDDKLLVFTDLKRNETRKYVCMMRVVNAGKFIMPPISAQAMYDPEFESVHGGQIIEALPATTMSQ